MNRVDRFLRLCTGIAVLFALAGARPAAAEEWDAAALLRHMPEELPISIMVSSPNLAIEQLEKLLDSPLVQQILRDDGTSYQQMLDELTAELGVEPVTSAAELLQVLHVDGTRPIGAALGVSDTNDDMVFLVPVSGLDGFLEVAGLADSAPLDMAVGEDSVRAGVHEAEKMSWFHHNGYVVIATLPETLNMAAAAMAAPRPLTYGSGTFPQLASEGLFVHMHMNVLAQTADARDLASIAFLQELFDEVLFSACPGTDEWGLVSGLAAHKRRAESADVPGPLSLPALFPASTVALTAWRVPEGLASFVETVIRDSMPAAQASQAVGALNLTAGVLGDEVAFGLLEADPAVPRVLVAARCKDPQLLLSMLALAGTSPGQPVAQHGGVDIFELNTGFGMFQAYYAILDNLIMAGAVLEDVQGAIDRARAEPGGSGPLEKEIHARANQGVVYMDLQALLQALESGPFGLPPGADMEMMRAMLSKDSLFWVVENRPDAVQVSIEGMDLLTPSAVFLPALARAREAARRASSQNNLKQMGLVFKMYANEHPKERFPAYPAEPGRLAPDPAAIYPEYLSDPTILTSPGNDLPEELATAAESDPAALIDDHHYFYLAFAVLDEQTGADFIAAYKQLADAGEGFDQDVKLDGDTTVYRLREGIERFFIDDVESGPGASWQKQSELILMFERPGLRVPDGGNVLFMDGHVEFLRMGMFPYTDDFLAGIAELDAPGSGPAAGDDWLNLISNR